MDHVYGKALATIEDFSDDEKFGPHGGFTAIASTETKDRDGENVYQDEWELPLPGHITIDSDHGMKLASTIGSAHPYFNDEGQLMIDAKFSSIARAQEARTLVKEGHIRTVSVAFLRQKNEKSGKPRRELLNVGLVAIPANPEAVILDSKALDARAEEIAQERLTKATEPETKAEKAGIYIDVIPRIDQDALKRVIGEVLTKAGAGSGDGALVQAIHDAAGHLGAQCVVEEPAPDEGSGSDDGANNSIDAETTGFVIGGKSVVGTLEDLQERVGRALCSKFPNDYPYARATYLNDDGKSGTVVYRLGDDLWAAEFMDDGADVEVDEDNARPVGLITTLVDDPDGKSVDNAVTDQKLESFDKALDEVLTPQEDSPEESPAEAAAASDEEPAPADEAADKSADDDMAIRVRSMHMRAAAGSRLLSTI